MPDDRDHHLDRGGAHRASGPSRRSLIGAAFTTALLAATSACSGSSSAAPKAGGEKSSSKSADPDPGLLAGLRSAEEGLIAQYDALMAQFPELATKLAPMRADHAGHLAAAGGTAPVPGPLSSPTPTPSAAASAQTVLTGLAGAEHAAAASRVGDCGNAHGTELARLLASIGACEAAHAALLTELARNTTPPRKTKGPAPLKSSGAVE